MIIRDWIKNNMSFVIGLRHFVRFVNTRFIKPKKRNVFGYFGKTTILKTPALITNPSKVYLYENVHIRENFSVINYSGKLIIKKFCEIAPDCTIVTGNHTPTVGVPQFIGGPNHINDKENDIVIEEGVWIGIRVTLISGAHVGRGSVIGACSLVNKEIPPYAVVVGCPAKIVASVFNIDEIVEHEKKLYIESERFSRTYLEQLFDRFYRNKKTIGKSTMIEEDWRKVAKAWKSL